jgi:hypothetical protein
MRLGPVIVERGVGSGADTPCDRAVGEGTRLGAIPLLRGGGQGEQEQDEPQRRVTHANAATRRLLATASIALLAACGGTTGPSLGLPRSALLALAMADSADPIPTTCIFRNDRLENCNITFSDSVHTLFASLTFAPGSVVSRNDTLLADTSTIVITVSVTPGTFEMDIEPKTLVFNETGEPVAQVSFQRYADPSVYTQSSRYASAAAFEQALQLWRERTPDHWVEGRNSSHAGPTAVTSALEGPGSYLVGALK